jgi:hypothetical protein
MLRFFAILILFIPFLAAQDKQNILYYPSSVVANTPFEISLINSTRYPDADKLEIILSSYDRFDVNSVVVNTFYGSSEVVVIKDNPNYKAILDLKSKSLTGDMNYQVLFNIQPDNVKKVRIEFSGNYYKGKTLIGSLFDEFSNIIADVDIYKPNKYAGKALCINEGYIDFTIKDLKKNRLTTDFWFMTPEKDLSLLNVYNRDESVSELFINSFGMLSLQSKFQNKLLNPYFISQNSWNHIALYADYENGIYQFYCNGTLVSSNIMDALIIPEDIRFSFGGAGAKEIYIEQLQFSRADENGLQNILDEKYYTSTPDNIGLVRIFRFDSENLNKINSGFSVNFENVKFVKSDAPLSLRAPELNINLLSSSFELEWNEGDFRHAQQYLLERSDNNKDFIPVYSIAAENNPEAKYRYTDKRINKSEIIFYRVKQILKDGSAVYSPQVKVGQGFSEPFTMGQNFPNPFNPRTSIDIELFRDSDVEVVIFNLEGKEISRLFHGNLAKGKHYFSFDASEYPSGIYICRVNTPDFSQTTKMILTK